MNRKSKKNNNIEAFRNANYSILTAFLILVLVIVANFFLGAVDEKYTRIGLSEEDNTVLSDITNDLIDRLDQEVTIYTIAEKGNENKDVEKVLKLYNDANEKVILKTVDPANEPQFLNKYGLEFNQGSLLIECGNEFKNIELTNLFVKIDEESNQVRSDIEGQVTSAIAYVSDASKASQNEENISNNKIGYILSGEGYEGLDLYMANEIKRQNIELLNLNLIEKGTIPDDADVLIINRLTEDFTNDNYSEIMSFLDKGGALFITNTYKRSELKKMPNYDKILERFGIIDENGVIVETTKDNLINVDAPVYLIPKMNEHEITNPLISDNKNTLLYLAGSIKLGKEKEDVTVDVLLKSSKKAYFKQKQSSQVMEKLATDPQGEFILAVAAKQELNNEKSSVKSQTSSARLVLVTSYAITDEFTDEEIAGGNGEFTVNSLKWLTNQSHDVSVSSKPETYYSLVLSARDTDNILAIIVVIPIIILLFGLFRWQRRRKR